MLKHTRGFRWPVSNPKIRSPISPVMIGWASSDVILRSGLRVTSGASRIEISIGKGDFGTVAEAMVAAARHGLDGAAQRRALSVACLVLHAREALCPVAAPVDARGLRAAAPAAGSCPGRFWRSGGRGGGPAREDRLLLPDPAAFRRLVRQGLSTSSNCCCATDAAECPGKTRALVPAASGNRSTIP